jgi:hypothetical protein
VLSTLPAFASERKANHADLGGQVFLHVGMGVYDFAAGKPIRLLAIADFLMER